jgi:hypothetical protein
LEQPLDNKLPFHRLSLFFCCDSAMTRVLFQ